MITYKITNSELFDSTVIDVDTEGLTKRDVGFHGTIGIETVDQGWTSATGQHGQNDYEDEYGFVLEWK